MADSNPSNSPDGGPYGCCIFVDPQTGFAYSGSGQRTPEYDQPPQQAQREPG